MVRLGPWSSLLGRVKGVKEVGVESFPYPVARSFALKKKNTYLLKWCFRLIMQRDQISITLCFVVYTTEI